jgi:hypothetical protein
MKLRSFLALTLTSAALGCEPSMGRYMQLIHPEYRERVKTEAIPVGETRTVHCDVPDFLQNPRARRAQRSVHGPVVEAQLAKLGATPVPEPEAARVCQSLLETLNTVQTHELDPMALRDLHPGGDQNVLYVWSYLTAKGRNVVDSMGRTQTLYDETEVVEYNAFLINSTGDIIFNGIDRCGLMGEDYYGSYPVVACDGKTIVSKLLDGAPFEMPADVAESFLAKQARQQAEHAK